MVAVPKQNVVSSRPSVLAVPLVAAVIAPSTVASSPRLASESEVIVGASSIGNVGGGTRNMQTSSGSKTIDRSVAFASATQIFNESLVVDPAWGVNPPLLAAVPSTILPPKAYEINTFLEILFRLFCVLIL